MANEPNKIIYSMVGVSKYYDKKPVLALKKEQDI